MDNDNFKKTKSFKAKLNFLIIFLFVLGIGVFGFKNNAEAATYYMNADGSEDCSSLQECFGIMSGGDELVIRDGTYTGAANEINHTQKPPNGTSGKYTIIKAEHPGAVIFNDVSCSVSDNHYIQYDGLLWHRVTPGKHAVTVSSTTHPTYIKFTRCGVWSELPLAIAGRDDAFSINTCDYVLLEDCYAYGNFRYGFYVGKYANAVVLRRCVARLDAYNTETDMSTFMVYDGHNIEIQNCIGIDVDSLSDKYLHLGTVRAPHLVYYRQTASGYDTENVNFVGSIFLNINGKMIGGSEATDVNFVNTVFWHGAEGIRRRNGGAAGDHLTIGNISGGTSWSDGWYSEQHTDPISNSIIADVQVGHGLKGTRAPSDYNALYGNISNYFDATIGSHDLSNQNGNEVNPFSTSLLYLPRIESGSPLSGVAFDGSDIGATVLHKIGISGTMYGELGYNTVTSEPLWPFPNEELIAAKMKAFNHESVNGNRGFCADGTGLYGGPITLTSYIWEYLGNPCPTNICNYSQSDTTPPTLSNGSPTGTLPSGTTQTTLSITTNENSTCKYSTIPETDYSSIPNTFTTTGGTTHLTTVTGLTDGNTYNYYIRCQDESGNSNTTDTAITFSISPTSSRADVDNNSQINTTDAMLTLRNSLGLSMTNTNWQTSTTTGDVNCDNITNSTDAMLILRYSLGLSMEGTGWCVE